MRFETWEENFRHRPGVNAWDIWGCSNSDAWEYYVPYQDSIEKALKELQEREFLSQRYGRFLIQKGLDSHGAENFLQVCDFPKQLIFDDAQITPEMLLYKYNGLSSEVFEELKASAARATPKALLQKYGGWEAAVGILRELWGGWGTQSILDIEGISEEPEQGFASAFHDEDLRRMFGTTQPSRAVLNEFLIKETGVEPEDQIQSTGFFDSIGKGEGRYIILFQGERPSDIYWVGYSPKNLLGWLSAI